MNSIAIDQILFLFLQCFIVAVLLLTLFRLRSAFGLALLFTALGVFQYMQVFLANSFFVEVMPGILVTPGSMVLFTGSLFAILLVYIREDALEARKVIYGLLAANLVLSLLQFVFSKSLDGEGVLNVYNLPIEFFIQNARVLLVGTLVFFIDAFIVILIYEFVSRYLSLLFLRIFFSMALVLSIDSLLFSIGGFAGTGQMQSILVSGLISKVSAAILYSALFSFYLLYLDKGFGKKEIIAGTYKDIFNSLTFRQKYEQVSQEKEIQKIEMEKAELKTSSILDAMDDIVFVLDPDNRYTSFYANTEELYLSADKFIGKKLAEVMPAYINELFDGVLPEVKAGKTMSFEYFLDMPNGKQWYSTKLSPMMENNKYSGLAAVARDITESKQAENTLKQTHERLTDTLESMSDGFVSLDKNWMYTYVNKRAAEIFGRKPEDLIGKHIWTEFPEGLDQPFYKTYYKVIETQKQISFENYYQPWDRWFENKVIPTKDGLAIFSQDITERKNARELVQKSEAKLNEAQRIAKIGSWELNLITNTLSWSDEVYRLFDLEPQQFEATYEAFLDNIHPDDREFVAEAYSESLKNKTPYNIVHRLLLPNEIVKYVNEFCETFYDDAGEAIRSVGTVQDITERKQAEMALRNSEEYLSTLMNSMADPVFTVIMPERKIEFINEAVCKLFGYKPDEIIGNTTQLFYSNKTEYVAFGKLLKNALKNNKSKVQFEQQLVTKKGDLFWAEVITTFLFSNSQLVKGISVVRDITERKRVEKNLENYRTNLEKTVNDRTKSLAQSQEALLNLVDDLNFQSAKLEKSNAKFEVLNKELESFSYSVSHDLRAPLRGIDGFSLVLLEDYADKLDEQGKDYLNRIRHGSQKMALLIDEMLNLSRLGRRALKPTTVNLSEIAQSISIELRESDPQRHAEFFIAKNISGIADPTLIKAVLQNILENAWKFTSKMADTKIEFGELDFEGKRTYFVKDNGAGFNMEYKNKLFTPFQRLHQENEFPGTGIGLTTVQRIIHRHNGTLWADSKVNSGATFYFTLNA